MKDVGYDVYSKSKNNVCKKENNIGGWFTAFIIFLGLGIVLFITSFFEDEIISSFFRMMAYIFSGISISCLFFWYLSEIRRLLILLINKK